MRAGINGLTAALVVGVFIGLLLTPDGRGWLRHPTFMLGDRASASASPSEATTPVERAAVEPAAVVAPAAMKPAPVRPVPPAPVVAPKAAPRPAPSALPDPPRASAGVTPLRSRLARGSLKIGVFGDSMADGLWTALYRDLNGQHGVTVTKFSEVSTGLSRYDYVNVQTKTARQIRDTPVDVAVVLFGANDAQAISIDGQVHAFGTPGWKAAYGKRIDDLVAMLRANNVAVYWVGLPRMRRENFDARMTIINSVVKARMAALNVPLIETTGITSNAQGQYEAYLPDANGRPQLMRANDGIHMTMAGYRRMAAPVSDRLRRDAGLSAASAG